VGDRAITNFAFEPGYRLRDRQTEYDSAGITAAEVIPPQGGDDRWTMFFSAWQDVPAGTEVPLHPSRDPDAANSEDFAAKSIATNIVGYRSRIFMAHSRDGLVWERVGCAIEGGETWDIENAGQLAAGGGQEFAPIYLGDGVVGGLLATHEVVPVKESKRTGISHIHKHEYTLRLDGFVSAQAPMSGGELVTKPITFTGKTLRINFATSAAGSLRVELQDEIGKPLPGFSLDDCEELFGDTLDRSVHWNTKANLSALIGRPVRVRFELRDADLYSFQFRD
jgi:hypothetical protein